MEIWNSENAPHVISGGPQFPAYNIPQVHLTTEPYQVHQKLKAHFSAPRRPVIADGRDELVEFARKAVEVHQFTTSLSDVS